MDRPQLAKAHHMMARAKAAVGVTDRAPTKGKVVDQTQRAKTKESQ